MSDGSWKASLSQRNIFWFKKIDNRHNDEGSQAPDSWLRELVGILGAGKRAHSPPPGPLSIHPLEPQGEQHRPSVGGGPDLSQKAGSPCVCKSS